MGIRPTRFLSLLIFGALLIPGGVRGQGISQGVAPPSGAKNIKCKDRPIPQLEDITEKAGIRFAHNSSPDARYILESMGAGVLLLDYDRDGWLDIYFTNAPTLE